MGSTRRRLATLFALLLAIMLGLTACLCHLARQAHLAGLRRQLLAEARLIGGDAELLLLPGGSPEGLDALAGRWSELAGARVTIVGPDGAVLGESLADRAGMDNHLSRPEVQQALATGQGTSLRQSRTAGYDMLYVASLVSFGGQPVGVVRLALPMGPVEAEVARQRAYILAAMLAATVALALCLVASGLLPRRPGTDASAPQPAGPTALPPG